MHRASRPRAYSRTRRSPYHTDEESDAATHSGEEHAAPRSTSSVPRSAMRRTSTRSDSHPKMVRVGTDGSSELDRSRAQAPGSMSRHVIDQKEAEIRKNIARYERRIKKYEGLIDSIDPPELDPKGVVREYWRSMWTELAVGEAFLPRKENGRVKYSYLALIQEPRHPRWVRMQNAHQNEWDRMRAKAARLEAQYLGPDPWEGEPDSRINRFFNYEEEIERTERKMYVLRYQLEELIGDGYILAEKHDALPYYSDSDGKFRPTAERPATPALTEEERKKSSTARVLADQAREAFRRRGRSGNSVRAGDAGSDTDEDDEHLAHDLGRMGYRAARRYSFSRKAF